MKLNEIPTRKLKRMLTLQKKEMPDSNAVRAFERELYRREGVAEVVRDEFLSLKALAIRLEIPEEYLTKLAKHGVIPSHVDSEGQLMFRLISVIDCLVKLNPKDQNISKTFSLYKILMGFHNEVKTKTKK